METERSPKSLSAQISRYSELIQSTPGWEYAGVFADSGISGTTTNRPQFQAMLDRARIGEIDLILTKSISRFARNTVDLLKTIRELKTLGVEVRFDKEGISTFSADGELVLTLLASRSKVDEVIDRAVAAELDTTDLHIEADQLFAQVGAAAEAIDAFIARNARVAQDQTEYQRRFDKLTTDHAALLEEYHRLLDQISDLENRQAAYRYYKEQLATLDSVSIKFTPYLWHTLVDHAEVGTDGAIMFTFRDGSSRQQLIGK